MEQEKEVRRRRRRRGVGTRQEEEKLGRWAMLPVCMSANSQTWRAVREGEKSRRRNRRKWSEGLFKYSVAEITGDGPCRKAKVKERERNRREGGRERSGTKRKGTRDKDWEGVISPFLPPLPSLAPPSCIPDWLKAPLVIVRSCRNHLCVWGVSGGV